MSLYVILACLGAFLLAAGMWCWTPAAGLVVGGLELLAGAYIGAYVQAKVGVTR